MGSVSLDRCLYRMHACLPALISRHSILKRLSVAEPLSALHPIAWWPGIGILGLERESNAAADRSTDCINFNESSYNAMYVATRRYPYHYLQSESDSTVLRSDLNSWYYCI